ncbi:ankyrin repeat domain-containing protein [Halorhodospira halophila]|uniref:Ankyrin n=1 Tax=Halorhodospira halophila (strain DSM 244 / SL1) TaxID=349124 RepID=A1WTI0_HALHL|nr:ankyrin repeat domain-containing protein [Halorhodospira halophila]ABM60992.1 Ankyrin [Halorhodospira halophila SL1]
MRWIQQQIADHPFRVLVLVLVVIALVRAIPDPEARDAHGRTPLVAAAYEGNLGMARMWLLLGGDIDVEEPCGTTALMRAIQHGHTEMANWLLDRGADPAAKDETGLSALHLAARKGERDLAERLVEGGADPELADAVHERDAIEEADDAGYERLAEYLRDTTDRDGRADP